MKRKRSSSLLALATQASQLMHSSCPPVFNLFVLHLVDDVTYQGCQILVEKNILEKAKLFSRKGHFLLNKTESGHSTFFHVLFYTTDKFNFFIRLINLKDCD